jgi:4-aminobutyrate aminotransferase-like enzyme/Ser/Thr protein kinase RdoA (MazF antagonist)
MAARIMQNPQSQSSGKALTLVEQAPKFAAADAVGVAEELYGIAAVAQELPSERDQNFLLRGPAGREFVLKLANAAEQESILDLQNRALEHLATRLEGVEVPRLRATRDGRTIARVAGAIGAQHFVRLLSYVPGVCLAQLKRHSPELLASLGAAVARMDQALAGFAHPAMRREFHWDLKRAGEVRGLADAIADSQRRALVESLLERFAERVEPALARLRAQVIHNDANDYNVLVRPREEPDWRVTGVLDFGDMVHAPLVCDLAVAATYAMLGKPDPVAAAAHVVAGYHAVLPLVETELAVLRDLICARLCLSVTLSAVQQGRAPENDYLCVSEAQAWAALEQLAAQPAEWAHYVFRQACGLPACPRSGRIVEWLRRKAGNLAPVVGRDLKAEATRIFDLSAASLELPSELNLADVEAFTEFIFGRMKAEGAAIGVGRWNEARLCYRAQQFGREGNDGMEWRAVHIGMDVFLEAGSAVFAPLGGRVHSFRDNALPLDYGPTIILEHDAGGVPFFTLYGHLSRESLAGLRAGQPIERGQQIATLGDAQVNGGWPPHLHFQIIADMLGRSGDFPGVAAPSERELWLSISPDPNVILQIPAERFPAPPPTSAGILESRRRHLGPSLTLSYKQPVQFVRGYRQYLWDETARIYLDAVNNVPHVGHSHPRVAQATQQQAALLNTNTRYLHARLAEYIERLTTMLPAPLRVCFLVNSGSEANELALRLARAHTRRRDVVVLDGAYHGNTASLVEISPYKFAGPGGEGCPPHVHVVPTPDTYRGPYKATDPEAGAKYAGRVAEAMQRAEAAGRKIGAFIHESLPSAAGMIVPPAGYLREAYRAVRAAGGVCIADEVQVGFGRTGTHFWGFQAAGADVVPDIVTLGKPIGNGHPMGAVVTSREIAASFANGMEYFNTFGGNPVSCAVGLAVLDVLREERLQENAGTVGERLLAGLAQWKEKYALIGDVRAMGFFIGVELVRDRMTLEPAAAQASYVAERMKQRGILIGTEGPLHNVLKIRPPMCFAAADADELLATLAQVLEEDFCKVRCV